MISNKTINYYDENAKQYFKNTISVDMSVICDRLIGNIKPGGCVIDIGAGSGRDMLYFKEHGFKVEGLDASPEMCKLAEAYTGTSVECVKIQDWTPNKKYDGIWANASLLHLSEDEIKAFLQKLPGVLEDNGCAYLSFKSGIVTGEDEKGRFFTNITEEWIQKAVAGCDHLQMTDFWKTKDKLSRDEFHWLNMILKNII